jgi:hypothetical protein
VEHADFPLHGPDIFRDESDRVAYLDRIEHHRERHRCIVYAYVLMSNFHLLIETGAVGLSKNMRGIQFSYISSAIIAGTAW